jgi:hypothetical protein
MIIDFTHISRIVIESEKGELVAEITQDEITVSDGYIATLIPTEVRA